MLPRVTGTGLTMKKRPQVSPACSIPSLSYSKSPIGMKYMLVPECSKPLVAKAMIGA